MEYLVTISPQGQTILYETYNIKNINLFQPVSIPGDPEAYYMVVIEYDDGNRENAVIPHYQWKLWNEHIKEVKDNG